MPGELLRREGRTEVNWIAMIQLKDGSEIPCSVKDVSNAGMKISIAESQALPETFMVKIVGKQLLFRVRATWRRQHELGVTIDAIAKLRTPTPSPDERPSADTARDQHHRLGARNRFRVN